MPHQQDSQAFEGAIARARVMLGRAESEGRPSYHSFGELWRTTVARHPDKTFLIFRDGARREEWTYGALSQQVARRANYLCRRLGLRPNDRIATVAYNHPDTVAITFAAWSAGVVAVPINIADTDKQVQFVFENAEVKAVFVMPDWVERVSRVLACMAAPPILVGLTPEFVGALAAEDAEFVPAPEATPGLETQAVIVYTSGTTGLPKGVVLGHHQILADTAAIAAWHGFGPDDRLQIVLPIHHVNGLLVTLVTPVVFGGSAVLNRKFHASDYWQVAAEERVTSGSVVPTILALLCEANEDTSALDLSRLKYLICAAGPLTVELLSRFEDRFDVRIVHGYGLSETTAFACFLPLDLDKREHDYWLRAHGFPAIGVAIDCNEMAVLSETGAAVEPGQRGEIVVRGPNVMQGYHNRPEANAAAFQHGWFRTGDEGFFERDGKGRSVYFITGRLKELIIRGGVNHSPLEIDEVISAIPGVRVGMAVGFAHDVYGEEVGAYVVRHPSAELTAEAVLAACAAKLSFAKRPKVVVFGTEIPVTATGKYKRSELKGLYVTYAKAKFRP